MLGAKTKPCIGMVWSGTTKHKGDARRSIALKQWLPLLEMDAEFHSLQKEVRPEDEEVLSTSSIISHREALHDFSDTAALLANMDLVITVDTSVAHLAGAMGKPVWILLAFDPDFRWLLNRDDSPWYPTARLFRQPAAGDWDSVIAKVRAEKFI